MFRLYRNTLQASSGKWVLNNKIGRADLNREIRRHQKIIEADSALLVQNQPLFRFFMVIGSNSLLVWLQQF